MEKQEIMSVIAGRQAGTMFSIVVDRPAKLRAAFKAENIRKRSSYALQLASYANRAPVKNAVATKDRAAPQTPAWVEAVEKSKNGLTFWKHSNGQEYLALPVFGEKVKSHWTENGEKVDVATIAAKLLGSETKPRPAKVEVEAEGWAQFNAIKLENIASIA